MNGKVDKANKAVHDGIQSLKLGGVLRALDREHKHGNVGRRNEIAQMRPLVSGMRRKNTPRENAVFVVQRPANQIVRIDVESSHGLFKVDLRTRVKNEESRTVVWVKLIRADSAQHAMMQNEISFRRHVARSSRHRAVNISWECQIFQKTSVII